MTITSQTRIYFLFTQFNKFTRANFSARNSAMSALFYAIVRLHCFHVILACIFIGLSAYFIVFHPLNYPTGTEHSKKTGSLFKSYKELSLNLLNKSN